MRAVKTALVLGVLGGLAAPAGAQTVTDYDDCIALVATDAGAAERAAGEWARFGGGAPARHCYALALIAVGAPGRAADELLGLAAEEGDLSEEARADVLVQAGELLLDEGDAVTAAAAADQALRLVAAHRGALGLRGAVKTASGDYAGAVRDLNRALAIGAPDPRLLIRRAAAHRLNGTPIAARDDAVFATETAPSMAAAWLERGRAEARLGDRGAARASFLEAIALDRTGPIGRGAQLALQRMEAGVPDE